MNLYAIAAAVWLVSLAGVGFWQHHVGAAAEDAQWLTKQAKDTQTYNDELQRLTAEARQKELSAAQRQAQADQTYQENLANANHDRDHALAQLRAGTLRLRDPGATVQACAGAAGATAAASGERDGGAAGGLSSETSEFLVGLATDANTVVAELAVCQAVVRSDRQQ